MNLSFIMRLMRTMLKMMVLITRTTTGGRRRPLLEGRDGRRDCGEAEKDESACLQNITPKYDLGCASGSLKYMERLRVTHPV